MEKNINLVLNVISYIFLIWSVISGILLCCLIHKERMEQRDKMRKKYFDNIAKDIEIEQALLKLRMENPNFKIEKESSNQLQEIELASKIKTEETNNSNVEQT